MSPNQKQYWGGLIQDLMREFPTETVKNAQLLQLVERLENSVDINESTRMDKSPEAAGEQDAKKVQSLLDDPNVLYWLIYHVNPYYFVSHTVQYEMLQSAERNLRLNYFAPHAVQNAGTYNKTLATISCLFGILIALGSGAALGYYVFPKFDGILTLLASIAGLIGGALVGALFGSALYFCGLSPLLVTNIP